MAKLMAAVSLVLGLGFVAVTVIQSGLIRFDSYAYYPDRLKQHGIDTGHYRDQRDPDAQGPPAPSVQSLVVAEPYLQLVMRYVPRRHNELIVASCPGVEPLRRDGLRFGSGGELDPTRARAAAQCVGALFKTSLDGRHIEDLVWDFTTEPGTGLPALTTFIAIGDLAPGRHELDVLIPGRKATPDKRADERHVIPFWR